MKKFVPKREFLEFIEEKEIVSIHDLIEHFGFSYKSAANRLYKYVREGLLEPLYTERGKYILSVKGIKRLEALRR